MIKLITSQLNCSPKILPTIEFHLTRLLSTETDKINKLVENKPIVVFMKGTPAEPLCGFSNAVVQVLRMHGVTKFDSYNVLEDESIRQGVKKFSNWPTIPQVYFNGEFIGGCDLFIEMHQNGDLVKELEKIGITSLISNENNASEKGS